MTAKSDRNMELAEDEFQRGVTRVESRPSWIGIETSAVCNLRCVQCPREDPNSTFTETRMDKGIIPKIMPYVPFANHLQLHGLGEPLLDPSFWIIVEDVRAKDVPVVDVNTNGTLFSDMNVDRLVKSYVNQVSISLDAATAPTYRKIRGGNFDKVIAGIRRLVTRKRELGKHALTIILNMTLMMENIHELPAFIELARSLGVDQVDAWHMNQSGDSAQQEWRITRDGWTFDYGKQLLTNAPAHSNAMVRQADAVARERGVRFPIRPELWLPV